MGDQGTESLGMHVRCVVYIKRDMIKCILLFFRAHL